VTGPLAVVADQRSQAAQVLAPEVAAYVAAGAGAGASTSEAEVAWGRLRLRPRVLRDVAVVDTAVTVLGATLGVPLAA